VSPDIRVDHLLRTKGVNTLRDTIAIAVVDGSVVINDVATVITPDVMASNGVTHVIDAVLVPAS
jgi:uncharacterized surface protein with fasciclin (FAS1) repeats